MVPVTYATQFQSKTKTAPLFRVGSLSVRFLGFIVLAVLALLYIAQSSQGATKRITIQQTRAQADELTYQQSQLKIEADRLNRMSGLAEAAPQLGLEPVTTIEFLK